MNAPPRFTVITTERKFGASSSGFSTRRPCWRACVPFLMKKQAERTPES